MNIINYKLRQRFHESKNGWLFRFIRWIKQTSSNRVIGQMFHKNNIVRTHSYVFYGLYRDKTKKKLKEEETNKQTEKKVQLIFKNILKDGQKRS